MDKKFSATGPNGTFEGSVEVVFNEKKVSQIVHNRSTHDEEERLVCAHYIKGRIPDNATWWVMEAKTESEIPDLVVVMEKKVQSYLDNLASQPKVTTIKDILKEKGYN